jgi:soluble lytic murein transglycosylase
METVSRGRPARVSTDRRRFVAVRRRRLALLVGGVIGGIGISVSAAGTAGSRPAEAVGRFTRGVSAFRSGDYSDAEKALRGLMVKNDDWALYLHAESAFYAGSFGAAREDFGRLSTMNGSRFREVAGFRAADCDWAAGAHAEAANQYRRLLVHVRSHSPPSIDLAVARFRVALAAEEHRSAEAPSLFLALFRDMPAHPLATAAEKHLPSASAVSETPKSPVGGSTTSDRLRRAETLTRDRHWTEALDELAKLPPDLPLALQAERDFQIGMTKFQMRRDYGRAAELLLAAGPALSGDKAASALFHGTRALSRIDRDDEAISGYKQVVARFPNSRFAAEAQFLSGWLDYNRGRFREALPALLATLEKFGKSAFADDAAWCVAFAHFLLGELPAASAGLDRYARMHPTGMTADERAAQVAYWRARIDAKSKRPEQATIGYREVNRRWPFSFYGAAARARLRELGEMVAVELPHTAGSSSGPVRGPDKKGAGNSKLRGLPSGRPPPASNAVPTLARADELAAAGLDVEAGWELQLGEKAILQRVGTAEGMRLLLARYPLFKAFRRAYELAETRAGRALYSAPEADPEVNLLWRAAYPRAYGELVDQYGRGAGNPDLFLYAIMRKESGFSPWDVSVADARGLLQMIPPTSAKVAASAGIDFSPDELFDPEMNIRLGALYIGALSQKFGGQIPVVAGAYNAGPKAMAKWCDQHGGHPMDEFIELIAFTQTREYSKRVVGIYARYKHLYGPQPYQMPIAVDRKYAATGPDY